jgi:hypothetical protein
MVWIVPERIAALAYQTRPASQLSQEEHPLSPSDAIPTLGTQALPKDLVP